MNRAPSSPRLQMILNSINQLRPLPTNATRVLNALNDPNVSAGLVAEYLGLDQALSALILRIANSVTFGYTRTCTNLKDAVVRLGFKRVRSFVMGAATTGSTEKELSGYRLGTGELWNHAVATAMAAEWLSRRLSYPDSEEAYVAGLLHDMGKLVLDQYVLSDYTRIVEVMSVYKYNLWQAERELLGIDHATVGGLMAERWEFPPILVESISCHHSPGIANIKPALPAIVNFANSIACRSSKSVLDMFNQVVQPETAGILRLDGPSLQRVESGLSAFLGMS